MSDTVGSGLLQKCSFVSSELGRLCTDGAADLPHPSCSGHRKRQEVLNLCIGTLGSVSPCGPPPADWLFDRQPTPTPPRPLIALISALLPLRSHRDTVPLLEARAPDFTPPDYCPLPIADSQPLLEDLLEQRIIRYQEMEWQGLHRRSPCADM
ncbi:hypothetical protein SKAU_G00402870 [Synaphobranchus kaupii]|uniref:Uncharacterized protein n=1 Tax=Synaphobranchus kaupii TaxID=118154 RepID=A0A9Q1IAJ2_SYNKA|nr:hypothetical protein SKAU_G00402870 [Synaphobranchus kaupii]